MPRRFLIGAPLFPLLLRVPPELAATARAAGKIYRIGILSTERRASLREVGR
ncbi:MAG: hypothetical protein M3409_03240 [Gemmatimonadota bacterium]|nr:hypothetical protein [Gemmatimonadota bacterium]